MEYLNYFIDSKTASVADHMRGWNISDLNTLSVFGLWPDIKISEVGYIRISYFMGFQS